MAPDDVDFWQRWTPEKEETYLAFKGGYGLKMDAHGRERFKRFWQQRQLEEGGPIFVTEYEADAIRYWTGPASEDDYRVVEGGL